MKLKIAVASQNRKTVTAHLGRCRKFWIYSVENGSVIERYLLELPKQQSFHESSFHDAHPLDDVSVIISAGMGQNLKQRLARKGIDAIVTEEGDPDAVVKKCMARH